MRKIFKNSIARTVFTHLISWLLISASRMCVVKSKLLKTFSVAVMETKILADTMVSVSVELGIILSRDNPCFKHSKLGNVWQLSIHFPIINECII